MLMREQIVGRLIKHARRKMILLLVFRAERRTGIDNSDQLCILLLREGAPKPGHVAMLEPYDRHAYACLFLRAGVSLGNKKDCAHRAEELRLAAQHVGMLTIFVANATVLPVR